MSLRFSLLLTLLMLSFSTNNGNCQEFELNSQTPQVWKNPVFESKTDSEKNEYQYATIEIALINPNALRTLQLTPPRPQRGRDAQKEWERTYKDTKHLSITLNFAPSATPWGQEFIMPLYTLNFDKKDFTINDNSFVTLFESICKRDKRYASMPGKIRLEKIKKDMLSQNVAKVLGTMSQVGAFVMQNINVAPTTLAMNLLNKSGELAKKLENAENHYIIDYKFTVYPFGKGEDVLGIIREAEIYTFLPKDMSLPNPIAPANINNHQELLAALKKNTQLAQIVVIYRLSKYKFTEFFNTTLNLDELRTQERMVGDYVLSKSISEIEENQLKSYFKFKNKAIEVSTSANAYLQNKDENNYDEASFVKIISTYYNFINIYTSSAKTFKDTDLFKTVSSKWGELLSNIDNELKSYSDGGNTLLGLYTFFEILNSYKTIPTSLEDKKRILNKLLYIDDWFAKQNRPMNNNIVNAPYYLNAKDIILKLSEAIVEQEFGEKLGILINAPTSSDDVANELETLAINENSIVKHIIDDKLKAYRKRKTERLTAIEKLQAEKTTLLNQHLPIRNVFEKNVGCIETALAGNSNLNSNIRDVYQRDIASIKTKITNCENLYQNPPNEATTIRTFIDQYNTLRAEIERYLENFKRESIFQDCFK